MVSSHVVDNVKVCEQVFFSFIFLTLDLSSVPIAQPKHFEQSRNEYCIQMICD